MSTNCKDCEQQNPQIPNYSQANALGSVCNNGCGGSGNLIYPPGGGGSSEGKTTEILPGFSIGVDDLSDALVDRFRINWVQAVQLTVDLTLEALAGATAKSNPVLWGTVIDEINLTWVYNRNTEVETQTLVSSPTLSDPVIDGTIRLHSYTGQALKNINTSFTISGNDGKGLPESTASQTKSITFGNYHLHGVNAALEGASLAALTAVIEGFVPGTIKTSRNTSFFAESVTLERDYYAIPLRFGYATFSKNGGNGNGGFKRLKNDAGIMVEATNDYSADPGELAVPINNGLEAEDYLIYMSVNDNIADSLNPITIT